jgi:hypothetical protein
MWKTVEERKLQAHLRGVGVKLPEPKLKNAVKKLVAARRMSSRGFAPGGGVGASVAAFGTSADTNAVTNAVTSTVAVDGKKKLII